MNYSYCQNMIGAKPPPGFFVSVGLCMDLHVLMTEHWMFKVIVSYHQCFDDREIYLLI